MPQNSQENICVSLDNVVGLRSVTLFKKSLWHSCFFCNVGEVFNSKFFVEYWEAVVPN